jgi:transposase
MEASGLKNLTSQEFEFVSLLLSGASVEQAGESIKISRRTAFLWKKKPHIQAALEAGQQGQIKIVEEIQREKIQSIVPEMVGFLTEIAPKVLERLFYLSQSAVREETQLKACSELLRLSGFEKTVYTQSQTKEQLEPPKQRGLTKEAADAIRRQILGIPTEED